MEKINRFDVVCRDTNGLGGPELRIIVDKATGVNYLFASSGYAGGLTPLLNPDGTPVITPISRWETE